MAPNWTRFSGVESTLAPTSSRTSGPEGVSRPAAPDGRSPPRGRGGRQRRPSWPVEPALTTASAAAPSRTRSVATRMEDRRRRTPAGGDSPSQPPRVHRRARRWPDARGHIRRPLARGAARHQRGSPHRRGSRRRLMAPPDDLAWERGRRPSRRPRCASGRPSAAGLGRGGRRRWHHLSAVVPAAGRAHGVGALQLMAVVAFDQGRGSQREMSAAFALARFRHFALGDAHAAPVESG